MFLQIHTLRERSFSCPNRDKDGKIKQGKVGGINRVRQSPQNYRRPIRLAVQKLLAGNNLGIEAAGIRSVEFPDEIAKFLVAKGKSKEQAEQVVNSLFSALTIKRRKENAEAAGEKDEKGLQDGYDRLVNPLATMLFLGKSELAELKKIAIEFFDELAEDKPKDAWPKSKTANDIRNRLVETNHNSVDIALFGRFVPSISEMSVEGAVEVNHPFSVGAAADEIVDDYFVAVDDISGGSPMMGGESNQNMYSSSTMYQHINLNLATLSKNIGNDEVVPIVAALLVKASASAESEAKRTSSAEHGRPFYIRAIISEEPLSLSHAFETPIKGSKEVPVSTAAIAALNAYHAECSKKFSIPSKFDAALVCGAVADGASSTEQCQTFQELLSKIEKFVRNGK
jgi:CRISPR system Cascade subunit CasC